ncbi:MAG: ATP-binding cassette domain-containing protein [Treponema sp.]|jgi:ATP-binding cassette subfamily C protein|nr:ATP-binding cassette domain-containing protein [Treponema sp.]
MMDEFFSCYKVMCNHLDIDVNLPPMNVIKNLGDPVEEILYLSGLRHKEVVLPQKWWRKSGGVMLGKLKDGTPVTLLPNMFWGYRFFNPKTGVKKRINVKTGQELAANAVAVYRTFPSENIKFRHFTQLFQRENLLKDTIIILLCCLIGSIIQVLPAIMSNEIFNTIIPENMRFMLIEIVIILIVFELVNIGFSIMTNLGISRLGTKIGLTIHTALFDRLLYLKMSFFNKYTAGELLEKIKGIDRIKELLFKNNLKIIIFHLFIFVEIIVLFRYCAEITPAVLLMFAVLIAINIGACSKKYKINLKLIDAKNKAATFAHQSIQGMHRVIVSGAEERVYNFWNLLETEKQSFADKLKRIDNSMDSLSKTFRIFSTAVVYLLTMNAGGVSMGAFIAFISTFFIMQRSIMELFKVLDTVPELLAVYNNIKPVFESPAEYNTLKSVPSVLSGSIEMNHVVFRYDKFGRTILNDVSIKIEDGECVGILGTSGSGKSTLIKLLMGFHDPTAGKIYYGGYDLETIDLRYLRKNLNVVLQHGNLTVGDIASNIAGSNIAGSNIAGSNNEISENEILELLKLVELEETINSLPKGMYTLLEECRLSPGEMQKLLIAKAIAKKSRFIFLDEATSHLDNEAQNKILKTIKQIPATKIIVAQRLETVQICDRIIIMENGAIKR